MCLQVDVDRNFTRLYQERVSKRGEGYTHFFYGLELAFFLIRRHLLCYMNCFVNVSKMRRH